MDKVDKISTLLFLRNKFRLWRNIAIILGALCAFFITSSIFEDASLMPFASNHIAHIKISGIILEDEYRSKILKKIEESSKTKALIVEVNSPGGGIVGSEILYEELRRIAAIKPVVIVMQSLAASGGYMISLASDHIIARNGTITGSVGVIMQAAEVTSLAEKLGIKFKSYKSAPGKAYPSITEKTNPELDKVIQASIDDSYDFFSNLVLQRRGEKLKKDRIKEILDGRVFTGRQALASGLVDQIGGQTEALKYLKEKFNIDSGVFPVKNIPVVEEESGLFMSAGSFFQNIFSKVSQTNSGLMAVLPSN